MAVLSTMIKYIGYYIVMSILIALFTGTSTQIILTKLCGAAISISMFSAVIELLLGGMAGAIAHRISEWCMRGAIIAVLTAIVSEIGMMNIINFMKSL